MSSVFEDEEGLVEAVNNDEGFEHVLAFLHFSCGDGGRKVHELVWFIEHVRGDLVGREVGDLLPEEGV